MKCKVIKKPAKNNNSTTFQVIISDLFIIIRHVMLPKTLAKLVPKTHLMTESEWRAIGVQQSRGWVSSSS